MIRGVVVAAGVVLMLPAITACSSPETEFEPHNARITVNGQDAVLPVSCSQFGWDWKINTLEDTPGFTARLETGNTPGADSVEIRDVGGFTGSYWLGTTGDGKAVLQDNTFTLSGTAVGYTSERPNATIPVTYEIQTDC